MLIARISHRELILRTDPIQIFPQFHVLWLSLETLISSKSEEHSPRRSGFGREGGTRLLWFRQAPSDEA